MRKEVKHLFLIHFVRSLLNLWGLLGLTYIKMNTIISECNELKELTYNSYYNRKNLL